MRVEPPSIQDIMTKNVITVRPETPLLEAAHVISTRGFSGLPVVTEAGKLSGILTEYDLLTKGTAIHLPTFIKLLQEFQIYKNDKSLVSDDVKKIVTTTVGEVMNDDPFVLSTHASLEEALLAFSEHHRVNPIPIVDGNGILKGIVSRYDVIKFYSPFAPNSAVVMSNERNLDKKMDAFLHAFEKKFIFVSRFRSKYWLFFSLLFLVVGFFIALFIFGRIVFNY